MIYPLDVKARIALGKSLIDQGFIEKGIQEYNKIVDSGDLRDLYDNNLRFAKELFNKQK